MGEGGGHRPGQDDAEPGGAPGTPAAMGGGAGREPGVPVPAEEHGGGGEGRQDVGRQLAGAEREDQEDRGEPAELVERPGWPAGSSLPRGLAGSSLSGAGRRTEGGGQGRRQPSRPGEQPERQHREVVAGEPNMLGSQEAPEVPLADEGGDQEIAV